MRRATAAVAIMMVVAIGVPVMAESAGASTLEGQLVLDPDTHEFVVDDTPLDVLDDLEELDRDTLVSLVAALLSMVDQDVTVHLNNDDQVMSVTGQGEDGEEITVVVREESTDDDANGEEQEGEEQGDETEPVALEEEEGEESEDEADEVENGEADEEGDEELTELEGTLERHSTAKFAVDGQPLMLGPPWYVILAEGDLWEQLNETVGEDVTVFLHENGHVAEIVFDGEEGGSFALREDTDGPPPWAGGPHQFGDEDSENGQPGPPPWVREMLESRFGNGADDEGSEEDEASEENEQLNAEDAEETNGNGNNGNGNNGNGRGGPPAHAGPPEHAGPPSHAGPPDHAGGGGGR